MGTFTLPLKDVIEYNDGKIGLDSYPIFDDAYRDTLNGKIIEHYFNQEIGQETIEMFVFAMRRKMNEIMPLYNQLYKSQALEIDPLLTFRSSSTSKASATGTAESTGQSNASNLSDSESKSKATNSNYPQTVVTEDGQYADTGADSLSTSTAQGSAQTTDTGTQETTQATDTMSTAEGFSGSMSALLLEYRQTFLNIDMLVIDELRPLFMLVWDNGDAFSQASYGYGYGYGRYYYGGF